MNQKQHIIPQVYLKQFGYRDKNGTWKVPTFNIGELDLMQKLGKTLVRQSNIKSLLQEVNIYDIPIGEMDKKVLEEFFTLAENHYPKVIEEISLRNELTVEKKEMLLGFISLLYVRTKDYRIILNRVIENKDLTYMLGIFEGDKKRIDNLLRLPREAAINFLIAFSGIYLYKCLQNFNVKIIKAISEEKWATTDNPVSVTCKLNEKQELDFMGIDTKIICPLSPDYLAYIDHTGSEINLFEGCENLIENKVNEIPKQTFEKIWHALINKNRATEYLVIPTLRKE